MFPRNLVRAGISSFVAGMSRVGSVFVLPVIAEAHLEAVPLLQSSGRSEASALALGYCRLGFSMPLRSHSQLSPVSVRYESGQLGVPQFL